MKSFIIILLLLANCCAQSTIGAAAQTFKTNWTGTALTSCQQVMNSAGTTYVLNADLSCPSWAFDPTAANISIRGNGHTLTACTSPSTFAVVNEAVVKGSDVPPLSNIASIDTLKFAGKGAANPVAGPFVVVSIEKIGDSPGATDYTPFTDYIDLSFGPAGHGQFNFNGAQINWIGGHQPTLGATYYVSYHYSEPCAPIWHSAFDPGMAGATTVPLDSSNVNGLDISDIIIRVGANATPYSQAIHIIGSTAAQITLSNVWGFVSNVAGSCADLNGQNVLWNSGLNCNNTGTKQYLRDYFGLTAWRNENNLAPSISGGGDIVGLTATGSAQAGLYNLTPGIKIHGNNFAIGGGYYSNDFQLESFGDNVEIYNNNVNSCLPNHGSRGIGVTTVNSDIPLTNVSIHNNKVCVQEQPNNLEYSVTQGVPVCQSHGTYGIQYDTASGGMLFANTVEARANGACDAHALRLTSTSVNSTFTFGPGDVFTAPRIGNITGKGYALSCDDCEGGTIGQGETFSGDSAAVFVDVDGAKNFTVKGATLGKGINPDSSFHTIIVTGLFGGDIASLCSGTVHCNIFFQDTSYTNGASQSDVSIWEIVGTEHFDVVHQWSYTPTFVANSTPLSGASVLVTDNLGHSNTYTTDASGHLIGGSTMASTVYAPFNAAAASTIALPQIRYFNVASGNTPSSETSNPYSIAVSKAGCTTLNYSISLSAALTENRSVSCP